MFPPLSIPSTPAWSRTPFNTVLHSLGPGPVDSQFVNSSRRTLGAGMIVPGTTGRGTFDGRPNNFFFQNVPRATRLVPVTAAGWQDCSDARFEAEVLSEIGEGTRELFAFPWPKAVRNSRGRTASYQTGISVS